MIYEKPGILTEEAAALHRKVIDQDTYDFLKFAYVKCNYCGKEMKYEDKLPRGYVFLHLGEDGKMRYVNPETVEPYCLDCYEKLHGGNNEECL